MEFDKSKVYTAVNADEVKVGSFGYFADSLGMLRSCVRIAERNDQHGWGSVMRIAEDGVPARFLRTSEMGWNLFYLVEEPEEKKFRPYKDTDEMIEDFKKRYSSYGCWNGKDNPMYNPLIWVKDEKENKILVHTMYSDGDFLAGDKELSLNDLLDNYTYLDGSLCGIEEAAE